MNILENKSNAMVIKEDNILKLVSYTKHVASYNMDTKEIILFKDWDYSRTTSKHINKFLNDYTTLENVNKALITKLIKDSVIKVKTI